MSPVARPLVRCVCLALTLCTFTTPLRADNPPKFKDPEITAYFQAMSDMVDGLLAAVQVRDVSKIKEWDGKILEASKTYDGWKDRVSPEEDKIAADWSRAQRRRLLDAGWTPGMR